MAPQPLSLAPREPAPTPTQVERDIVVTVFSTATIETPTAVAPPKKSPNVVGPIVGGLVGGIAAGIFLALGLWWFLHRRKQRKEEARAAYERRRARLHAQRHASRATSLSSTARLKAPSEKSFDPSIPVPAPPRHSIHRIPPPAYLPPNGSAAAAAAAADAAMSEKTMGYAPEPLAYVPAGGDFYVQQPYEQPSLMQDDAQPIDADPFATPGRRSPPSPPSPSSPTSPTALASQKRKSRGTARAAAAEMAAASAAMPRNSRHRPKRPSPLARAAEHVPLDEFGGPVPGPSLSGSPVSSMSSTSGSGYSSSRSPTSSPPSSESHAAYAAAAIGSWSQPTPDVDDAPQPIDFSRPATDVEYAFDEVPSLSSPRGVSGQYTSDPFAEYHDPRSRAPDAEVLATEYAYDTNATMSPSRTAQTWL